MNENNNIPGPQPMPNTPSNINPTQQPAGTYVNPQPMGNVPSQPQMENVPSQQPMGSVPSQQPIGNVPSQPVNVQPQIDPMAAVANLNKEEAMEEALSHTTQYSPFEVPKQEVNQEVKKNTTNKSAYIFIGIIFLIMLLFILFLPTISKLFGW